jgi:hypothetical protein
MFLNAAKTSHSASWRFEASNLLRLISRQMEVSVSDYGVSISALPSTITFPSMRGSLGSPLVVVAFGCTMKKHGIIIISVLVLAMAGHRDGGKSTRG